jgi:hypothetical protein
MLHDLGRIIRETDTNAHLGPQTDLITVYELIALGAAII